MNVYGVEAKVAGGGTLNFRDLPFQEGDEVQVIIRALRQAQKGKD